MHKNRLGKDLYLIGFLLVISYLAVYVLPTAARPIVFLGMIYFFLKTKNNAPWVVFFFLLFSAPATLFYGNNSWFLYVTKTVGIEFSFVVAISFLIKGFRNIKWRKNSFSIERNLYLFMLFFLFIVGYVHGGLSMRNLFIVIKGLPNILLILCLPLFIDLRADSVRIKKLLYIITITLFSIQIIEIIMGRTLFHTGQLFIDEELNLQRNITGIYFAFFALIISLSDLLSKGSKMKILEAFTAFSAVLIIINAATRGWMIAGGFIVVSLLFLGNKSKVAIIGVLSTFIISLFLIFGQGKYVDNISGSFGRMSTVVDFLGGDETAGGTLSRVTERGPRVMKKFWESPVLGFGFSDTMVEYYDGHVGNAAILVHSGIIGFSVIYLIIIRIIWHILRTSMSLRFNNVLRFRLLSMVIGLLGIMIIHLSSREMITYRNASNNSMLLAFWILYTIYYLNESKKMEKRLDRKMIWV